MVDEINDLDWLLSQIAPFRRIGYGSEEPKHLPADCYAWDSWLAVWVESDKAFRKRIIEEMKRNAKREFPKEQGK